MPIATNGSSIEVSNLKVLKNFAYKIAKKILHFWRGVSMSE